MTPDSLPPVRRLATADAPEPPVGTTPEGEGASDERWNTTFRIRQARPGDPVDRIVEGFRGEATVFAFGRTWAKEEVDVIVADAGGALLGIAVVSPASERLPFVAVPPLGRGMGAIHALVSHAEKLTRGAGGTRLMISLANDDTATYIALREEGYALDRVGHGAFEQRLADAHGRPPIGLRGVPVRDEFVLVKTLAQST